MSKNTNCLEGIRCPECGQEDEFEIDATATLLVTDDGWDLARYSAAEWGRYSSIKCTDCGKLGEVAEFTVGVGA